MNYIVKKYPGDIFVLKRFYTASELKEIFSIVEKRTTAIGLLNKGVSYSFPALFSRIPTIKKFIKADILQEFFSRELHLNNVRVTDHSDFHINVYFSVRHTDSEQYLPKKFNGKSHIYKVGIFDNINLPTIFYIDNKIFIPPMEFGDVLIFPIEILHASPRIPSFLLFLKHFKKRVYNIPFFDTLLKKQNRKSIFFTIGLDSGLLSYFERKNLERERKQIC